MPIATSVAGVTGLAHERLVEVIPRQGYAIAPVTFEQVRDLYEARLTIEPAIARLAAERTTSHVVADLEQLNRQCLMSRDRPDLVGVREANKAFHGSIARATGNQRLTNLATTMMDELDRILYLPQLAPLWDRLETTFAEHNRIIDALRNRDARSAELAARKHVLANQKSAIETLLASPQLRAVNLLERSSTRSQV